MFGIKTRKDKRIEELEEELKALKRQPVRVVENKILLKELCCKRILNNNIPIEIQKEQAVSGLAKSLINLVDWDILDMEYNKILEGRIRVADKLRYK